MQWEIKMCIFWSKLGYIPYQSLTNIAAEVRFHSCLSRFHEMFFSSLTVEDDKKVLWEFWTPWDAIYQKWSNCNIVEENQFLALSTSKVQTFSTITGNFLELFNTWILAKKEHTLYHSKMNSVCTPVSEKTFEFWPNLSQRIFWWFTNLSQTDTLSPAGTIYNCKGHKRKFFEYLNRFN